MGKKIKKACPRSFCSQTGLEGCLLAEHEAGGGLLAHALIRFAFSCKKNETLNEMLREETLSVQLSNTWMKRQDAQGSEFQIKASQQHKSPSGHGFAEQEVPRRRKWKH